MITIAEVPHYVSLAEKLLTVAERQEIIDFLASRPKSGDLVEGTGGIRKLRWAYGGRGKSGGVRVIYYFHSEAMPLYLITLFAKNDRSNLTRAERNELAKMVDSLVAYWMKR